MIGRDGYSDADGSPLSLLDAIYYSTVTVTTTGYGDIAPISPGARAVTAFVVTPLRVVFLVVLVGTTLELLTERFRHSRAEARWRRTMRDHTIVAGYGTMGRQAVETLLANGTTTVDQVVVIDPQEAATTSAREAGLTAIMADATRTAAWKQAAHRDGAGGDRDRATATTRRRSPRSPPANSIAPCRSPPPCARPRMPTCSASPGRRPSSCRRRRRVG